MGPSDKTGGAKTDSAPEEFLKKLDAIAKRKTAKAASEASADAPSAEEEELFSDEQFLQELPELTPTQAAKPVVQEKPAAAPHAEAGGPPAEFLRKLDAMKQRKSGPQGAPAAEEKPVIVEKAAATGHADAAPPAEFLKKLDALEKRKSNPVIQEKAPSVPPDRDSSPSPEFLRKLDAMKQRKSGGEERPAEKPAPAPAPAPAHASSQVQTESLPSPEFLKKLDSLRQRRLAQLGQDKVVAPEEGQRPSSRPPTMTAEEMAEANYGIEKAMDLMRQLPIDEKNVDLMMKVVKSTLQSFSIKIEKIITDAGRKQELIQAQIEDLEQEIADLEKGLQQRMEKVTELQREFDEMTMVKNRLMMGS